MIPNELDYSLGLDLERALQSAIETNARARAARLDSKARFVMICAAAFADGHKHGMSWLFQAVAEMRRALEDDGWRAWLERKRHEREG